MSATKTAKNNSPKNTAGRNALDVTPLASPFTLSFGEKGTIDIVFPGSEGKQPAYFGLNDEGKIHAFANCIGDILTGKYVHTEDMGLLHVSMEDAINTLGCNVGYMRPEMWAQYSELSLPAGLTEIPSDGIFEVSYDGKRFSSKWFGFKYPDSAEVEPDQYKRDEQWRKYNIAMKFDAMDRLAKAQRLGLSIRLWFGEAKAAQIAYIQGLWTLAQIGDMDGLKATIKERVEKKVAFNEFKRTEYILAQPSAHANEIEGLEPSKPVKDNAHDRLVKKIAKFGDELALRDGEIVKTADLVGRRLRYWKADGSPLLGTFTPKQEDLQATLGLIARKGYSVEFAQ